MDDRFAERREAVAEARARRSLRRTLRIMLLAALVAGIAYLLQSPILSVDEIEIDGVARSGTLATLERFGIVRGEPLAYLDLAEAREAIAADPWVESVDLDRSWPTTVRVTVEERQPLAIADGVMVAVDGVILPGPADAELPSIVMGATPADGRYGQPEVLGALEFLSALGADGAGAAIGTGEEGLVALVRVYRVRLGRPVDMAQKALALSSVLDQNPPEGSEITLLAPERPAVLPPGTAPTDSQLEDEG